MGPNKEDGSILYHKCSLCLAERDGVTAPHPSACFVYLLLLRFRGDRGANTSPCSLQKLMDEVPLGDKVPRKK